MRKLYRGFGDELGKPEIARILKKSVRRNRPDDSVMIIDLLIISRMDLEYTISLEYVKF